MIDFILFVLVIGLCLYALDTKAKLRDVATLADQINDGLSSAILEDRDRMTGIEDALDKTAKRHGPKG